MLRNEELGDRNEWESRESGSQCTKKSNGKEGGGELTCAAWDAKARRGEASLFREGVSARTSGVENGPDSSRNKNWGPQFTKKSSGKESG